MLMMAMKTRAEEVLLPRGIATRTGDVWTSGTQLSVTRVPGTPPIRLELATDEREAAAVA
jgi:hypothetical protein